jgi:hypothetical protein
MLAKPVNNRRAVRRPTALAPHHAPQRFVEIANAKGLAHEPRMDMYDQQTTVFRPIEV